MSNSGNGNAAVAAMQQAAVQQPQLRGSSKPPLFEGTFELYQAELELYLGDRDAWSVVNGEVMRHATNREEQAAFDRSDRLSRAAILRGLRGCKNDDASKVCGMVSAKEMWDTLVSDHTQRDFSYAMLLKRQLYQCSLEPGQSMADYIRTVTRLRQQLMNMGADHAISDQELACVLLMGVAVTHKELVEQFDLPTRQGNPPTLQQVTNALRSRDERDRMMEQVGGGVANAMVMSMTGGNGHPLLNGGGGNYGSSNGASGAREYCSAGRSHNGVGGGKKPVKRCYHCKKTDHLKRDCWQYKNKSKKVNSNCEGSRNISTGRNEVNQRENSRQQTGLIDHMQWLNNGREESSSDEGEEMIGMVQRSATVNDTSEWMLDSGSATHVCIDQSLFMTKKKSRASFRVWTGGVTQGVMSGNVLVYAGNDSSEQVVELLLENEKFSPHGSTNLLSLGVMEKNGWVMSTNPPNEKTRKVFLSGKTSC